MNDLTEEIGKKVKNTIEKYDLIGKDDKVIVACSGGKDSTTILYLLKELGYPVEGLIIDLLIGDWSEDNLKNTKKFCKEHKIKLHVINIRENMGCSICYIRSGIQSKEKLSNCMICGVIKRWLMNLKARELGATKLVTGHNLDDTVEALIMNLFGGNPELSLGLGPKTGMTDDKKFVRRVKPLYFCTNEEVKKYSQAMNFPVLYEPCPCSVNAYRGDVRKLIAKLEKLNPETKTNIINNFLRILPLLKEKYGSVKKLRYCKLCGEPSRNDVCRRCHFINILKSQ